MLYYIIEFYYLCNTNSDMEAKKVTDTTILTNLEAEKHFSVNGRTLRRKAAKTAELNPKMVSKCTDGHYRAQASNWKKILGLH